jgi:pimeloyl-ACP methyl ester carboxylesterase
MNEERNVGKKTLLVVPGWLHNSSHWARAKGELAPIGWDVVVIDLPGFGVEPLVSKNWGVPEYSRFVEEKIRESRSDAPQTVVALGHSFGGRALVHMLATNEDFAKNISHLILYAAPCIYRPTLQIRLHTRLAHAAKKSGLSRILPSFLKPRDLTEATGMQMERIFKRTVPYDETQLLQKITTSTTLLWGADDTSAPLRLAREMQQLLPHAALTTLPNEGHNIHLSSPTLFYGTLRKILAGVV